MMFLWCRLEDALAEACRVTTGGRCSGSFHERSHVIRSHLEARTGHEGKPAAALADLPDRIDHVRRTRNLIVHSLVGVSSDPLKGEPHITCEQVEGGDRRLVRITQGELTKLLSDMDRCRSDLGRLDHPSA